MYMEKQGCFETPPPPSKKKVVLCYYRFKTWQCFGENCPVVTSTPKDSSMSIIEQCGTSSLNQNPVQPDPTG